MGGLELKNVDIGYGTKKGVFVAVKDLNLKIDEGELICIIGTSGCGKTTTLYAIAGLNPISNGQIILNGKEIEKPDADRGMVFQKDSVFPWLTVFGNIAYGLKIKKLPKKEIIETVEHYIEMVDLKDFRNSYPRELSGGMRKRVDLARAFANDPNILLMDEPFGSLDAMTKESLQMAILNLWYETKKTIIFITHDVEEAIFLSQRTAVMTSSPGTIKKNIEIPFPYPRSLDLRVVPEFQKYRAEVISLLRK